MRSRLPSIGSRDLFLYLETGLHTAANDACGIPDFLPIAECHSAGDCPYRSGIGFIITTVDPNPSLIGVAPSSGGWVGGELSRRASMPPQLDQAVRISPAVAVYGLIDTELDPRTRLSWQAVLTGAA